MEKKIVALKDLSPETSYPVVDLLKSNGERLGCATTAIINWSVLLGLLNTKEPWIVAEMALRYETELTPDREGKVSPTHFSLVLEDILACYPIEQYAWRSQVLPFKNVLTLLLNNFSGLLCSNTPGGSGHADVIFFREGKVYFNAFEVTARQLAELIYGDEGNFLIMGRNVECYGRAFISKHEMANLTFSLSEREKYFLSKSEIFLVENSLLKISEKFWAMPLDALVKEKEATLRALGLLCEDTRVI